MGQFGEYRPERGGGWIGRSIGSESQGPQRQRAQRGNEARVQLYERGLTRKVLPRTAYRADESERNPEEQKRSWRGAAL